MNRKDTKAQFQDNYTSDLTDLEYATMLGLQTDYFHLEQRLMKAEEEQSEDEEEQQ